MKETESKEGDLRHVPNLPGVALENTDFVPQNFRAKVAYPVAVLASVLALGLGVLPSLFQHGAAPTEYDAGLAVLTATLIALIWTVYHTFQGVQQTRDIARRDAFLRQHTRIALTTSILGELRAIWGALDLLEEKFFLWGVRVLDRPQLTQSLTRLDLFPVDVCEDLTALDSWLRAIEAHVDLYCAEVLEGAQGDRRLAAACALTYDERTVASIKKKIGQARARICNLQLSLSELSESELHEIDRKRQTKFLEDSPLPRGEGAAP